MGFNAELATDEIVKKIRMYFECDGPHAKAVIGISGGKDSTVVAMLCTVALGAERVLGIMMPQGIQRDIDDSKTVCEKLNIPHDIVNIGETCTSAYNSIQSYMDNTGSLSVITSNLPARIRMTILYAISAAVHGRVINTCNLSEEFVGWSTKYGDSAGDFAPLHNFTKTEVVEIGKYLRNTYFTELPIELITKTPDDGMCGQSDEDKFRFTYDELDTFIRGGEVTPEVEKKITTMYINSCHKRSPMPSIPYVGWEE